MYTDSNGLIVTNNLDGGDTLAEESRYWFLCWFNFVYMSNYTIQPKLPRRATPNHYMSLLEVDPGIYVRNPNQKQWWSDPHQTSRDQLQPVIWYCAAYKDYVRLARLFLSILTRGGFAQNDSIDNSWKMPDCMWMTLPDFIRAGGWWTAIFYPLLFILDIFSLLSVLGYIYLQPGTSPTWYNPDTWFQKLPIDSVDDNNTVIDILGAAAFKPTPVSLLTRKLFARLRPVSLGTTKLGVSNNCLAAIAWYHNNQNEEITLLYTRPILTYLR